MKKIAIVTLMFMLVASASSFATQTRTEVMGFNDGIMVDDYNVFRFPGRTFNYPNLAIGEFSIYNYEYYDSEAAGAAEEPVGAYRQFYDFGINWQFGEENPWVLGTYISTLYPMRPTDYNGNTLWNQNYNTNQNRRIQLIYGRQLGGNNFGFNFEYIRGSYETDHAHTYNDTVADTTGTTTYAAKESFGYYKFGFGLTEGTSGKWDIAASVAFGTWTDENGDGEKQTEPDGYLDLTAEGRYFWVKNPKITLVPHAGIMIGKRGANNFGSATDPEDTYDDMNYKSTLLGFEGGLGMHYTPGPDLLAVLDVGFRFNKTKREVDYIDTENFDYPTLREYTDTEFTLPYLKLGFEGSVFKWMDVRFGATTYWNIDKYEDSYPSSTIDGYWMYNYEYSYKDVWNETYLGFGFHWGRLHVDVMTDPDVFLRGFNFISGDSPRVEYDDGPYYESLGYMNTKMSVLYEMF